MTDADLYDASPWVDEPARRTIADQLAETARSLVKRVIVGLGVRELMPRSWVTRLLRFGGLSDA